jgi:hypothetical protein
VGQSIDTWAERVLAIVRDQAEADVPDRYVIELGVLPAIAQYSIDRPRTTAADIAASGRYLPFPTLTQGWQDSWSQILQIEAPAGQTPPALLLDNEWQVTRDPSTPTVKRILLPAGQAGETCRIVFTAAWPTPDNTESTDLIPPLGFSAICALAAAMVCTSLGAEAARDRQGAMPSDFVDGSDRSRDLLDAAQALRTIYHTFIGLGSAGGAAPSVSARTMRSTSLQSSSKRMASTMPEEWPYRVSSNFP